MTEVEINSEGSNEIINNEYNLTESQQKRHYAVSEIYAEFLNDMIIGKQKQIRFRKWFHNMLQAGSKKVFDTEEQEYQFINKFGRGMWERERLEKTFSKSDMLIVVELARDYGAFDY
jgi:hypothetical protein